jgi:hypothetical protein
MRSRLGFIHPTDALYLLFAGLFVGLIAGPICWPYVVQTWAREFHTHVNFARVFFTLMALFPYSVYLYQFVRAVRSSTIGNPGGPFILAILRVAHIIMRINLLSIPAAAITWLCVKFLI